MSRVDRSSESPIASKIFDPPWTSPLIPCSITVHERREREEGTIDMPPGTRPTMPLFADLPPPSMHPGHAKTIRPEDG
jgi:hypothetical protein